MRRNNRRFFSSITDGEAEDKHESKLYVSKDEKACEEACTSFFREDACLFVRLQRSKRSKKREKRNGRHVLLVHALPLSLILEKTCSRARLDANSFFFRYEGKDVFILFATSISMKRRRAWSAMDGREESSKIKLDFRRSCTSRILVRIQDVWRPFRSSNPFFFRDPFHPKET